MSKLLYLQFLSFNASILVLASNFSPHVFPKSGPFFEGWYMRVTDTNQGLSIGLLFGHVEPRGDTNKDPLVVASLLFSEECELCKLQSYNGFYNTSQLNLTVHGHPVEHNPDFRSPAVFNWSVGKNIIFIVKGNNIYFSFHVEDALFEGNITSIYPWGPDGEGPEGWLELLPLPLHWFVYSLYSSVTYKFSLLNEGKFYSGSMAVAHLEKNWGKSFPQAWVWAQGVAPATNVTLTLSGGLITLSQLTVTAYLIGYRNRARGLVVNFKPTDSIVSVVHQGCDGYVNITAKGIEFQLYMHIRSTPTAFSDCLYGPEEAGFRPVCVESYNAVAEITLNRFGRTIDKQIIKQSALEFGGQYVCKDKCNTNPNHV